MSDNTTLYLGWADPDRKKPAAAKLDGACARHVEKFSTAPNRVLVGPGYGTDPAFQAEAERRGLAIGIAPYIPAWTLYVGRSGREACPERQEGPETEPEPAAGQLAMDFGVAA